MKNNSANTYLEFIKIACPKLDTASLARVASSLENTYWDNPTSAIDLNNFAVVALLEAERCQNLSLRVMYLEMALEALNKGVELYDHPLCAAHHALVLALIGEKNQHQQKTFNFWLNILQSVYSNLEKVPPAIVFLPPSYTQLRHSDTELLTKILQAEDGYTQSLLLLTEVLCRGHLIFYNPMGLRLLHLAAQIFPSSISINFKLGIASIVNQQWEGLLYLHRARQQAPDQASIIQSLYLAYRDLGQTKIANDWLRIASNVRQQNPGCLDWQWTEVEQEKNITYVTFERSILLAVEPSFRSIVTSVLIGEGDWFEKEMEFWRSWIEPGMTVIDVGANVGVYTFSAALRVGSEGRVLAIEPFSGCVRCLQETCRINQLGWVKVCPGAASDRNGMTRLSLHGASELNELVADNESNPIVGSFENVACFTLDNLVKRENLSQVHFIKIDAEGHELSVLAGSDRILSEFAPVILYENIAGSKGSNLPVADYLKGKGYKLFRYQPYTQELISLDSNEEKLEENLNIIALPADRAYQRS